MFKKIFINIIFFLTGLAVMFCFIKACDTFLWFRPSLYPLSVRPDSQRLIAKGGPFKIYSSLGTEWQDFGVMRGNKILVLSKVMSNNIYEVTYFEDGLPFCMSRIIQNRRVIMRDYTGYDADGHMKYVYFDDNADGLWDRLVDIKKGKSYHWRNDRWFQVVSDNPVTLGTNTFCMPTKSSDEK